MVCDQYQVMGLVIPPKLILTDTDLMYTLTVSGQWSGNEIILPVTANLNFWSRAILCNLALPEKCTDPERKCMRTRSAWGFFLTWVGSYENHCFGINAHTFLFQVGHPTFTTFSFYVRMHNAKHEVWSYVDHMVWHLIHTCGAQLHFVYTSFPNKAVLIQSTL